MFVDIRTLPAGTRIETDVCIVGAGAAGITLARELSRAPFRVCLVESGGLQFDPQTQALYRGESVGIPYHPLDTSRLRYFGGTTNAWAGVCRPLDEIDFESRSWIADSGWPFDRAHLDPFYARAHEVCQLGPYDYAPVAWETAERPRLPIPGGRVETQMLQFSPPTRFGLVYRDELARAPNLTTYLFANVVEIATAAGARSVSHLRVASLAGRQFSIAARLFVLAAGGIENARLLLASHAAQREGLGNQNDLVGRFFMEHLSVPGSIFLASDPELPTGLYGDPSEILRGGEGVPGKGTLILSPQTLRREKLLSMRAFLNPTTELEALRATSEGAASAGALHEAMGGGSSGAGLGRHLARTLVDIDGVLIYGYRRLFRPSRSLRAFQLFNHVEQAPNPESRVTLASERDALGMRRPRLVWRLAGLEKQTLRRANEIIGRELGGAGLGRVKRVVDDPETGWPSISPGLLGAWHHMGTTRMHADPKRGVVDADCRVHGIGNLFVAGSSVFPACGTANPTLTIVALALRLADHVKRLIG
jgi:choline dehydrogenase-like flavoprotein